MPARSDDVDPVDERERATVTLDGDRGDLLVTTDRRLFEPNDLAAHSLVATLLGRGMREKWAGANLNRGYGHPKAEGYQATPPARD